MNKFTHILITLALLFSLFFSLYSQAQGTLMITTPRIVFDGRERSLSVNLKNTGSEAGSYRVFFSEKSMVSTGSVQELATGEKASWSAAGMVRYSPRRVTLAAQQGQRIRLALRKPADLADGEYRSHLVFRSEPDRPQAQNSSSQSAPQFRPTFEFSIPVIIRHGHTTATAVLSNPALAKQKGQKVLHLTLNRTGNRSLYGDIEVFGLHAKNGSDTSLFKQQGIAHYTPLLKRKVQLRLPPDIPLHSYTQLRVVFQERAKYGGSERAELVFNHRNLN